jgi:hypothetical protein
MQDKILFTGDRENSMDMPSAVTSYIAKRTRKEKRYWQCCSHHCKPSNSSWRMRELIDKIKANKLELK